VLAVWNVIVSFIFFFFITEDYLEGVVVNKNNLELFCIYVFKYNEYENYQDDNYFKETVNLDFNIGYLKVSKIR
jgi:hypothetical protein